MRERLRKQQNLVEKLEKLLGQVADAGVRVQVVNGKLTEYFCEDPEDTSPAGKLERTFFVIGN